MIVTLFCLTLLFLQQPAEINPDALDWFQRADELIGTDGAFSDQHAEFLRKALEISPDFPAARFNLALVLLHRERLSEAEEQLDRLIELEPDAVRGYLLRAEVRLRSDRLEEAESDLDEVLALDPDEPTALRLKGSVLLRKGEPEEAFSLLEKSRGIDPENPGVLFDLAVASRETGDLSGAAGFLREYLEAVPSDADAQEFLASILRTRDRNREALQHLLAAQELRGDDARLAEQIAHVYLDLGELAEARRWFLEAEPESPATQINLGLIAYQLNLPDEAENHYRKALEKEPENGPAWAYLADVFYSQRQDQQALEAYEKAERFGFSDFTSLRNMGTGYANLGQETRAAEYLKRALEAQPRDAETHFHLGVVLERLDQPAEAREHYLEALANGSDEPLLHFRLAILFARQSLKDKALEHLGRALEKDPGKFLPYLDAELRNVHSDLDSIRYTPEFNRMLNQHRKPE